MSGTLRAPLTAVVVAFVLTLATGSMWDGTPRDVPTTETPAPTQPDTPPTTRVDGSAPSTTSTSTSTSAPSTTPAPTSTAASDGATVTP